MHARYIALLAAAVLSFPAAAAERNRISCEADLGPPGGKADGIIYSGTFLADCPRKGGAACVGPDGQARSYVFARQFLQYVRPKHPDVQDATVVCVLVGEEEEEAAETEIRLSAFFKVMRDGFEANRVIQTLWRPPAQTPPPPKRRP